MTKAWALKGMIVGATIAAAGFATQADAAPVFTFTPGAVGLSGSPITADNETLSDFSTITLTPNAGGAAFTDNGSLQITDFHLGSSSVPPGGLNSNYTLYYLFSATGQQDTPTLVPGTTGTFSSLTYQLYGAPITGTLSFSNSNTPPSGIGAPVELASGSLITGGVEGDTFGQPAAQAELTFTPTAAAAAAGFFSPLPFYNISFTDFHNNPQDVTTNGNVITITGGDGSVNYQAKSVPEPASLTLLGAAIASIATLRRKRKTRLSR